MDYFTDIEEIAKKNDIGIIDTEFQTVDGMCLGGKKGHLILLDHRLGFYRRRWAIAHELSHIADDTVDSRHSRIAESRADCMAMNTLISDEMLDQARSEYGDDCDFIHTLFGVSIETIQKKCSKF